MSVQQATGQIVGRDDALAVGTRVEAVFFDGTVVVGTVGERHWWFDQLMFYTVEQDANGRPYWEVPTFNIYPSRDVIRVIDNAHGALEA